MIERIGNRGILRPNTAKHHFNLTRHLPGADVAFFVDRYWLINWELDAPFTQETLPYPCINMVFEQGRSGIWGVVTGTFQRRLESSGQVFGIKFRPGAFYPFWRNTISQLTNRVIAIHDVFGTDAQAEALFSLPDVEAQIAWVEALLLAQSPEQDETIATINHVIDCIMMDRSVTRVDDLSARFGMSKRTLQRLFSQYVGVSPKWVIQRYRLQEAAERLSSGDYPDWTRLAVDLGYFDQAHFIKDFRNMLGVTPAEYVQGDQ